MWAPLGLALAAGMVATINPCGFALLPAYLAGFVGLGEDPSTPRAVTSAVKVSIALTAGFLTVFGLLGIVISSLYDLIEPVVPYATFVFGAVLIGAGFWLVSGRTLNIGGPKISQGGDGSAVWSTYLFGASYAVASLSCALPAFVSVMGVAGLENSFWISVLAFVAYGLGMGIVVGVLTVSVAIARSSIVGWFRRLLPYFNRISGGVMIVAGIYVLWYGVYGIRRYTFGEVVGDDPLIDGGLDLWNWLVSHGPTQDTALWWLLGSVVFLSAVFGLVGLVGSRDGRTRRRHVNPAIAEDNAASQAGAAPAELISGE